MGDYITALALKKHAAGIWMLFLQIAHFSTSNFPNTA
jgi:hypothetical protein